MQATKKQTYMLFCLSKKDYRNEHLTVEEASELIGILKREKEQGKVDKLVDYQSIWNEAEKAGIEALTECMPTPMVVQQHSNMMGDSSPIEKEWHVEGGVCGFAWVNIKPATSSFARWLKDKGIAHHDTYYGGITVWIHRGGQSMERKEAMARAMSKVFNDHGIQAHMMSRMD